MSIHPYWVYCVDVEGLQKIGHTQDVKSRIKQLHGVVIFQFLCPNKAVACAVEHGLHACFKKRLAKGREWFHLSLEAIQMLNGTRYGTLGKIMDRGY